MLVLTMVVHHLHPSRSCEFYLFYYFFYYYCFFFVNIFDLKPGIGSKGLRFLTLYILTIQCSDVNASSIVCNLMFFTPTCLLRALSNPGGTPSFLTLSNL